MGEKSYVVGRRDCDILVQGDPTVSRKHAELTMSHPETNLVTELFTYMKNEKCYYVIEYMFYLFDKCIPVPFR